MPCEPSTSFEWSWAGLPYPKLHLFVRSATYTRDDVALADAIDGMDLSEEWGFTNLNLTYQDDTRWAKWANEKMENTNTIATLDKIPTNAFDSKEIWHRSVAGKQRRGGWKYPKDVDATRFRMHGSKDPRAKEGVYV